MDPVITEPREPSDLRDAIAEDYRRHAEMFAPESPCFADWAERVAEDEAVLGLLATLPERERQPNLVFAAARWHGVAAPGPYAGLRAALLGPGRGAVLATMRARYTQTNEVARLACFTPVFAQLDGPLALVEVGCSAGLNLFPDGYDYVWDAGVLGDGSDRPDRPTLTCETTGPVPVPAAPVRVAARIGVDAHPLDVHDPDATAWLETLIWPEQDDRRERLRAAVEVARRGRITVLAGDLLERLDDALALAAESGGTPVVFHSAVIAYLAPDARARFHARMTDLVAHGRCHLVSFEGARVLPAVSGTASAPAPRDHLGVLASDGRALAWADLHGHALHWLDEPA